MFGARLKPGLWVKAQLRICDRAGVAFTVLRRGDSDGGSIILKILGSDGRADLLVQSTAPSGAIAWMRPLGPKQLEESDADTYIARQGEFDPDIWVLEVIDRAGVYAIDGAVLDDQ